MNQLSIFYSSLLLFQDWTLYKKDHLEHFFKISKKIPATGLQGLFD